MHIFCVFIISFIWHRASNYETFFLNDDKANLRFCLEQSFATEVHFSVALRYNKNKMSPVKPLCSITIELLLMLSGQVEINPGPKFPCGECGNAVHYGRSISCDNCYKWFHKSCLNMNTQIYDG